MTELLPSKSEILQEWSRALEEFGAQIAAWSEPLGWQVSTRTGDPVMEEDLPPYSPAVVRVRDGERWVEFEPTARLVIGGAGRVDVFSPLHHLTMLRRAEGWPILDADWTVYAPGNFPIARTWNQETFRSVLSILFSEQSA